MPITAPEGPPPGKPDVQPPAALTFQEKKWFQRTQEDIVAVQQQRLHEASSQNGMEGVQRALNNSVRWLAENTPLKSDRTYPITITTPSPNVPSGSITSTAYLPRPDDLYVLIANETLMDEAVKMLHPDMDDQARRKFGNGLIAELRNRPTSSASETAPHTP